MWSRRRGTSLPSSTRSFRRWARSSLEEKSSRTIPPAQTMSPAFPSSMSFILTTAITSWWLRFGSSLFFTHRPNRSSLILQPERFLFFSFLFFSFLFFSFLFFYFLFSFKKEKEIKLSNRYLKKITKSFPSFLLSTSLIPIAFNELSIFLLIHKYTNT